MIKRTFTKQKTEDKTTNNKTKKFKRIMCTQENGINDVDAFEILFYESNDSESEKVQIENFR